MNSNMPSPVRKMDPFVPTKSEDNAAEIEKMIRELSRLKKKAMRREKEEARLRAQAQD